MVRHQKSRSAQRVLSTFDCFIDARAFFDAKGNLKTIAQLDAEQGSQLASFDTVIGNVSGQDGHKIHKVRFHDKIKALEILARYFGLFTEKIDHSGEVVFRWLESSERDSQSVQK